MTIIIIVLLGFLLRKPISALLFSASHALGMEEEDLTKGKSMANKLFED